MPFNVCDAGGNHLGLILKRISFTDWDAPAARSTVYMVALTGQKLNEKDVDMARIRSYIYLYEDKKLFGRRSEERLKKAMEEKLEREYAHLRPIEYHVFLKYYFLEVNARWRGEDVEQYLRVSLPEHTIRGFILLDHHKVTLQNSTLVMTGETDCTGEKASGMPPPLFARVAGYPVHKIEFMGVGEGLRPGANLSDFTGRNHTHSTELKIVSGNVTRKMLLPFHLMVKKDQQVKLYLSGGEIRAVFTGEAFYRI